MKDDLYFRKMASNSDGRKVALITGITGQDGSYLAGTGQIGFILLMKYLSYVSFWLA